MMHGVYRLFRLIDERVIFERDDFFKVTVIGKKRQAIIDANI